MMWQPEAFKDTVIVPALLAVNSYSKAAERLVLGTAMTETGLRTIIQNGGGPGLGYFQMEPATHNDIWSNYIGAGKHADLLSGIRSLTSRPGYVDELGKNPKYAAAMCRIFYLRVREGLPNENNLNGLAQYWKKYYNTDLGKGTVRDFEQRAAIVMTL